MRASELRELVGQLGLVASLGAELSASIEAEPETLREVLTPPFYWATFYELPFPEYLKLAVDVIGAAPMFAERLSADDPARALLDLAHEEAASDWDGGPGGRFEPKYLFGVIYSINYTIESMLTWSKWLNELVADVRSGSEAALFKAVQIDRTIMSCPPIADRITLADYERDEAFFRELRNALKGKPKKPKEEYADLRYCLYALEEDGRLDSLTIESAYRLFCEELQLYPTDSEDPARSLWQFIRRWKKTRQST